jgi:hypothetical protein
VSHASAGRRVLDEDADLVFLDAVHGELVFISEALALTAFRL